MLFVAFLFELIKCCFHYFRKIHLTAITFPTSAIDNTNVLRCVLDGHPSAKVNNIDFMNCVICNKRERCNIIWNIFADIQCDWRSKQQNSTQNREETNDTRSLKISDVWRRKQLDCMRWFVLGKFNERKGSCAISLRTCSSS